MDERASRSAATRFSTADWPEQQRIEAFREIYGRVISRVELDRPQGLPEVTASFIRIERDRVAGTWRRAWQRERHLEALAKQMMPGVAAQRLMKLERTDRTG